LFNVLNAILKYSKVDSISLVVWHQKCPSLDILTEPNPNALEMKRDRTIISGRMINVPWNDKGLALSFYEFLLFDWLQSHQQLVWDKVVSDDCNEYF